MACAEGIIAAVQVFEEIKTAILTKLIKTTSA
jgi:hypothetical protein